MLESKWVLFTLLLFGFGQLLASQMSDIAGTSAEDIESASKVLTLKQLQALAPTAEEAEAQNVVEAALRGIGVIKEKLTGIVKALAWGYPFLDDGVGALFRGLVLWPLTGMMSLMIAGYVRNIIRL